jgi:antirestriction protein ArdC
LAHWAEARVGWKRFEAKNTYEMGELVAEMAACYLSTELNLPLSNDLSNHNSYLSHWLDAMKNDYNFIFKASSQASKVVDYLLKFRQVPRFNF